MPSAFFRDDRVRREMAAQALDDQPFARAIGFRDQIVVAFELKSDAAGVIVSRSMRPLRARCRRRFPEIRPLAQFVEIFDVVLEQEQIRLAVRG